MKRITLIATLILTVVCLTLTSSSSSQEKEQGAYVDPNNSCNFFQFVIGDDVDKAQAKKGCEKCAGGTCKYIAKVYAAPACIENCKNTSNSTSEQNNTTETRTNQNGGVSLENDADCPLPDCHYEMYQGARRARWEIKLQRKSSQQSNSGNNIANNSSNSNPSKLKEALSNLKLAMIASREKENYYLRTIKGRERQLEFLQSEQCSLKYKSLPYFPISPQYNAADFVYTTNIPLGTLDPLKINVEFRETWIGNINDGQQVKVDFEEWYIFLTTNGKETIFVEPQTYFEKGALVSEESFQSWKQMIEPPKDLKDHYKTHEIFKFYTKEDAEKAAKALKQAITLCASSK